MLNLKRGKFFDNHTEIIPAFFNKQKKLVFWKNRKLACFTVDTENNTNIIMFGEGVSEFALEFLQHF